MEDLFPIIDRVVGYSCRILGRDLMAFLYEWPRTCEGWLMFPHASVFCPELAAACPGREETHKAYKALVHPKRNQKPAAYYERWVTDDRHDGAQGYSVYTSADGQIDVIHEDLDLFPDLRVFVSSLPGRPLHWTDGDRVVAMAASCAIDSEDLEALRTFVAAGVG